MKLVRYVFLVTRWGGFILGLAQGGVVCPQIALAQTASPQSASPVIDTVVGGAGGIGDGGAAGSAVLVQPGGLAADSSGNIYIAETGAHRIRKVDHSGTVTTVAGIGAPGFSGDGGAAVNAQLNSPYGLACDRAGNLYIADLGNSRVRRVALDGIISTLAGGGMLTPGGKNEGSAAVKIAMTAPRNLAIDDSGVVYISDFNGQRVFRLALDGRLTTIAGTGTAGNAGDGGAATLAQLANPAGLAIDSHNALYIADSQNHAIRKIINGLLTTVLQGTTPTGVAIDLLGGIWVADPGISSLTQYPTANASQAFSFSSSAVIRGGDFNMYAISDSANTVMRISLAGVSSVFAGGGSGGSNAQAQGNSLDHPTGAVADAAGNIYIADRDNNRIERVGTDGSITIQASGAGLSQPSGVSLDAAGNLYIADTGNHRVLAVSATGLVQVLGSGAVFSSPVSAVADGSGNVYVADFSAGKIQEIKAAGAVSTVLSNLSGPRGLALAPGSLYFTEEAGPHVSQLSLATGVVKRLSEGAWTTPRGITVSSSGLAFVADSGRQQVLQLDSAGNLSIVAGTGTAGFSGDGGAAASAQLNFPYGVALTSQGDLLIADFANNRIRRMAGVANTLSAPGQITGGSAPTGTMQVLNGASLAGSPVAPGMLLSLTGSGLLASDMGDTSVLINSILAPIVSMSDSEIRVRAPLTLVAVGQVQIALIFKGAIAATVKAAAAAAAPALFAPVNTATNPAARGSIVALFGTGLGLGDLPVTVSIGGVAASVVSLDPSPGYPGLFQLNATVPASVPVGLALVTVSVGGATSQAGVQLGVN